MKNELEIVCASIEDAEVAQKNHATRIECCSALELGGCTPSLATIKLIKKAVSIPVVAMVRVRGGGFDYTQQELDVMFLEAKELCEAGADGIVFGFLTPEHTIDIKNTEKMVELVHSYHKEAIFHKAFDQTPNLEQSLQHLFTCKVDRVLTEGGNFMGDISKGLSMLAYLQKEYGDKIQLLAGGGIRVNNIKQVIKDTGITQIHSGAKKIVMNSLGHTHIVVDAQIVSNLAFLLFT